MLLDKRKKIKTNKQNIVSTEYKDAALETKLRMIFMDKHFREYFDVIILPTNSLN